MTLFYRATLESRNFCFASYEVTGEAAHAAMIEAVKRHCRQYNVSASRMLSDLEADIVVVPIEIGKSYRDGSEI